MIDLVSLIAGGVLALAGMLVGTYVVDRRRR